MIQKIAFTIIIILEGSLFILYDLSILNFVLYCITCLFAFIVNRKRIIFSFASWWLLIYLICSFLVVAVFKFVPKYFSLVSSEINDFDFLILAKTSIYVFFLYIISLFFVNNNKYSRISHNPNLFVYLPDINWKFLFFIGFILSAISRYFGIGDMVSGPTVILPYHIGGIIQFARKDVIPILALLSYVGLRNKSKSVYAFYFVFIIWCFFESWVRLSKSVILFSFLPIIIYEFLSVGKNGYGSIIKRYSPIIIIALLAYPVFENLRSNDRQLSFEFNEENNATYNNPKSTNYLVRPYTRSFYSGYLFLVDNSLVDINKVFDFSKASRIFSMGGSARFQTFVIDGYPEGAHHSSGSTPFIDAFLVGGYGLFFITILIFVFLASFIDYYIFSSKTIIIPAILCFAYYRLFDMLSASFFIDPMCIRYFIVYGGLIIYLRYKISNKRRLSN